MTMKKFLVVGEASETIFWPTLGFMTIFWPTPGFVTIFLPTPGFVTIFWSVPTPGFKGRTFVSPGFSTEGTFICASTSTPLWEPSAEKRVMLIAYTHKPVFGGTNTSKQINQNKPKNERKKKKEKKEIFLYKKWKKMKIKIKIKQPTVIYNSTNNIWGIICS